MTVSDIKLKIFRKIDTLKQAVKRNIERFPDDFCLNSQKMKSVTWYHKM
jgi:hypothetical protein